MSNEELMQTHINLSGRKKPSSDLQAQLDELRRRVDELERRTTPIVNLHTKLR